MTAAYRLLACSACGASLAVELVLDLCDSAWPDKNWDHFECPECHTGHHLAFVGELVKVGDLDGLPGPTCVVESTTQVANIVVEEHGNGLRVRIGGRTWSIGSA